MGEVVEMFRYEKRDYLSFGFWGKETVVWEIWEREIFFLEVSVFQSIGSIGLLVLHFFFFFFFGFIVLSVCFFYLFILNVVLTLLRFFNIYIYIYKCCADVENCGSFKGFGFIYIYRLIIGPCKARVLFIYLFENIWKKTMSLRGIFFFLHSCSFEKYLANIFFKFNLDFLLYLIYFNN